MKLRKGDILSIAFILILLLGLGYAFLTQNLLINGSGRIQNPTWNIYWDNVVVNNESVEILDGDQAATINPSNKTSLSYNISLSKPGDFYEFTVDAKNDGSIAGKIDSIESKMNGSVISTLPNYLEYSVTYDNGDAIEVGQILRSFDKQTYKIRIGYKSDINPSDLPQTNQQLNMTFAVTYVQGKDESNNPRYLYNWYDNINITPYTTANDPISAIRGYVANTPEELMNLSGYPIFLRHTIVDNKIQKTEIGVYDNNKYYYVSSNTTPEFNNMVDYYLDVGLISAQNEMKDLLVQLPNYQMFISDPNTNGYPVRKFQYGYNENYSIFGEKDGLKIGCMCSSYSSCECRTGISPNLTDWYDIPYKSTYDTYNSSIYFIPSEDTIFEYSSPVREAGAYFESIDDLKFALGYDNLNSKSFLRLGDNGLDIGYFYGENHDVKFINMADESSYYQTINEFENSNYSYDYFYEDGATYKKYHIPEFDIFFYDFGDNEFNQYFAKYGVFPTGSSINGCYCSYNDGCGCNYREN